LSVVNTATDWAATAPKPNATTTTTSAAPVVLPATLVSAARRPCASARPTMNSTLGPGITTSTIPARAKVSRVSTDGTPGTLCPGRAPRPPTYPAPPPLRLGTRTGDYQP
jgi:hypothetical protein